MSLIRLALAAIPCVALAAPSVSAQEDDWERLAPASAWTMDYADDSCALRRLFGEVGGQVFLQLRQYAPGNTLEMILASNDFARRRSAGLETTFLPDEAPDDDHDSTFLLETGNFGPGVITQVTLRRNREGELANELLRTQEVELAWDPVARDAREREITGLAVRRAFRDDLLLETGEMHAPMAAMRTCLDELLTHWGVDAVANRNLLRPVRPVEMERWSRELVERYPRSMLSRGEQAIVNIRLIVSAEGRPTVCAVQTRLNNEEFDALACELLLEYGRFEPALDGNGNPITSYWITRVIYFIA